MTKHLKKSEVKLFERISLDNTAYHLLYKNTHRKIWKSLGDFCTDLPMLQLIRMFTLIKGSPKIQLYNVQPNYLCLWTYKRTSLLCTTSDPLSTDPKIEAKCVLMTKLYFGDYLIKANTRISCNIGKSAKNSAGIFRFFLCYSLFALFFTAIICYYKISP